MYLYIFLYMYTNTCICIYKSTMGGGSEASHAGAGGNMEESCRSCSTPPLFFPELYYITHSVASGLLKKRKTDKIFKSNRAAKSYMYYLAFEKLLCIIWLLKMYYVFPSFFENVKDAQHFQEQSRDYMYTLYTYVSTRTYTCLYMSTAVELSIVIALYCCYFLLLLLSIDSNLATKCTHTYVQQSSFVLLLLSIISYRAFHC